jgi:hypothetical protein
MRLLTAILASATLLSAQTAPFVPKQSMNRRSGGQEV